MKISQEAYDEILDRVSIIGEDNEVQDYQLRPHNVLKDVFVFTDVKQAEYLPLTMETLPCFILYGEKKHVDGKTVPLFSPEKKNPSKFEPEKMREVRAYFASRLKNELEITA